MPAKSPGLKHRGFRKPTLETASSNQHKFESFTRRVGRLKIDPVHSVQAIDTSSDSSDLSQSFFRTSLDEWAELNLSHTFTSFHRKVNPLCENLPQLLYHQELIFETLCDHIERKDALALEPLLSLTAHLAHDLGQAYERYFSRTVSLITRVAAGHDSPEVIEWSFTCLAWMFKYLARLLIQDLRPLLAIMKPYLSHRKEYIVRFSAESLAFLLRKAAVLYPKRKEPLTMVLNEVMQPTDNDIDTPSEGIMGLLAEACIGVEGGLHSSCPSLLRCTLGVATRLNHSEQVTALLEGLLINLVHRTDAEGFHPVVATLLEEMQHALSCLQRARMYFLLGLMQVIVGTRSGTRIHDWRLFLDSICKVSALMDPSMDQDPWLRTVVSINAFCLRYAPMNYLLPSSRSLLDQIVQHVSTRHFFAYCALSAELDPSRFQDLLLPKLQNYITSNFGADEAGLATLLDRLHQKAVTCRTPGRRGYIESSKAWDQALIRTFERGVISTDGVFDEGLATMTLIAWSAKFPNERNQARTLASLLSSRILAKLREPGAEIDFRSRLQIGWGLGLYLSIDPDMAAGTEILEAAAVASPQCFRLFPFVDALNRLAELAGEAAVAGIHPPPQTADSLLHNMLNGSREMKIASIRLLNRFERWDRNEWMSTVTNVLLELSETDYTPRSARTISMLVRRLPQLQKQAPRDTEFQLLVPYFCLGLLSLYHEQTRKEVCAALSEMISETNLEDTIIERLVSWLRSSPATQNEPSSVTETSQRPSPFECTNLAHVRSIAAESFKLFGSAKEHLLLAAQEAHQVENVRTPVNARSLALETLNEMAVLVEKRSRQITPIFIAAQLIRTHHEVPDASDASISSHTLSPDVAETGWSFPDRRAFVRLFSKFQNPKVLYRSEEVHDKLYELLCNGNSEIRKLSLTAILKWKNTTLSKHQDMLFEVIDEKVANAKIGIMLNSEAEENPMQPEERPVVLPVLLRLLYGLLVGRSGTHGSQEARRKSVLRMLFRMKQEEVTIFLGIILGPLKLLRLSPNIDSQQETLSQSLLPADQQYGFLRMLSTLMDTLQSQFTPYGKYVVEAVLYCTLRACRQIMSLPTTSGSIEGNIRRVGLQCLTFLFANDQNTDWTLYMPLIFAEAISPRLADFALQTAQGISVLLRLFSIWSQSGTLVSYLRYYDSRVLTATLNILTIQSAKNEVKEFVLKQILHPVLQHAEEAQKPVNPATEILSAEMPTILKTLGSVLQSTPPKEILLPLTSILSDLGKFVTNSGATSSVIALLVDVLATSRRQLTPHLRSSVLSAIQNLLHADMDSIDPLTRDKLFELVSRLFAYFRDAQSRLLLCQILGSLEGRFDEELVRLCLDLNASLSERLDGVDFDRRLDAFKRISAIPVDEDTACRWQPILYNMVFYMHDEDFSIRSNAVSCLKGFIAAAATSDIAAITQVLSEKLMPAVLEATRDNSEVVRADAVVLFGLLVHHLPDETKLQDLRVLLVGNDEEASFFTNILHVQQHRRLRAIRRLVSEVEKGHVSTRSLSTFLIPLLQKFIKDDSESDPAQSPKGESLSAMRILLQWIPWRQFKTIFVQNKSGLDAEETTKRTSIKMLANAAEALLLVRKGMTSDDPLVSRVQVPELAASLPSDPEFFDEVKTSLLPKLANFAHYRDEADISSRLPIAITAVKLITLLPSTDVQLLAAPIILDVANILRSRAQQSRDTARAALRDMVLLLGPGSLQFTLGELRNALKRGYQLHVLSFTLHSLLVSLSAISEQGELDYCLEDMVSVIMDDIFGAVGQEKENQDYISSMREVKSSKSFDSMELLARTASIGRLSALLEPITTVLIGNLGAKQTRQVDELLRRIGVGLSRNPGAGNRDFLVFAYQAIQGFYKEKSAADSQHKTNHQASTERLLIQDSSARTTRSATSSTLLYKIARFAIDLVRSALKKHDELLTAENVHGFLPIIGDALVEAQEDVKVSALRLLSAIIKLRMPELDEAAPIYVREAVKIVQNADSTNDEAAQAALKLVAAVLRERKSVEVRESDVSSLLRLVLPDLEEPDRQGVSFNFVRAVMARNYQLPELYDVVDRVGAMMVTSQAKGSRDVARGVYVHFLIGYPQSPNRWAKQQKFLIKNLEFDHAEGRESVMEAINLVLSKTSGEMTQQLASAFFMPIVLRMANEDNQRCQEYASACLGRLVEMAEPSKRRAFLQPLEAWLQQTENPPLTKLAMQAFVIVFTVIDTSLDAQISLAKGAVENALKSPVSGEGDLPGEALKLLITMVKMHPMTVLDRDSAELWTDVRSLLGSALPHLQNNALLLVTDFFANCHSDKRHELPLINKYGLIWGEDELRDVLKFCMRIVRTSASGSKAYERVSAPLVFLGSCIDVNGMTMPIKQRDKTERDDVFSDDEPQNLSSKEMTSIPAAHYLLHQLTLILRQEIASPTTLSLTPKATSLKILQLLIPSLSPATFTPQPTQHLLLPLLHLTNPHTYTPHSPDPAFAEAYTALVQSAQELLSLLQDKLGDKVYVAAVTEASKTAREKREERRRKRVIERVADPERAAVVKRQKSERKKERNRGLIREFVARRKGAGY